MAEIVHDLYESKNQHVLGVCLQWAGWALYRLRANGAGTSWHSHGARSWFGHGARGVNPPAADGEERVHLGLYRG